MKGNLEEGERWHMCSKYVQQIIHTKALCLVSAQQMSAPLNMITCRCCVLGCVGGGVGVGGTVVGQGEFVRGLSQNSGSSNCGFSSKMFLI